MTLEAGSHVGRIRIDALLGSGGMGEVYRGWDEKLERAVALKVVHGEKRLSAAIRTRFLREARMLSRLDHPNISRIYDVVERDDGDYLVLELVEGRTLRNLLQAPIPRAQALDIALQVARVLTATHARDIIHRDLKPENVMINSEGQVKVLDFGLARSVVDTAPEGHDGASATDDYTKTAVLSELATTNPTHTFAGSIVGTLQYMSPEQARALPLREPRDINSLGVLLLEMLTGTHQVYGPVESPHELLSLVRRAEIAPFDSGDAALNTLVKRMVALHPADRPAAHAVVRDIESILTRPARIRRRAIAGATIAAILLAIAGAFFVSRRLAEPRSLFGERDRGKIAILPFRNETGDASLKWIEVGLANLVQEGVSRARGADVAKTEDVLRAMQNLGLSGSRFTPTQRRRLLDALGADVLIAPSVVLSEGKYTIRYAPLTADDEQSAREVTSTVLVEAAKHMSVQLAQRIDPTAQASVVRTRYSVDNVANMLYAIGAEEFQRRGPRIAAHYFTVCLDRDPDFVAARLMLAETAKRMADNERAHQLLAEALSRARERGDRELVARVLLRRGWWHVDAGEKDEAERDAKEAQEIGRTTGAREVVADALSMHGYIALRRGELDRGKTMFTEALRIAIELRDAPMQARLYNNVGLIDEAARRTSEARANYERAIELTDRTGDRYLGSTIMGNLGNTYGTERDYARAEQIIRRQHALARETGDASLEIFPLANLGLYLWAQGKEQEAIRATEQAAAVAAKVGNPRVETIILSNLATAHTKLGDLEKAQSYNDAAFAKFGTLNDPESERDLLLGGAYLLIRRGKLDEAARAIAKAEKWQLDGRVFVMRGRLAYARGDYKTAYEELKRAKAMDDPWFAHYELMLRASEESARTGKPSSIAFEGNAAVPAADAAASRRR